MGSLIEELRRREDAARAEAGRLRVRIEELSGDLARAEERASRLAVAREEVTRVMEEPAAADPPAGQDGRPAGLEGKARPVSRIGAVTVPPWQEGSDASVLPGCTRTCWKWRRMRAALCGRSSSRPRPGATRRRRRWRACGRG
jgi:hypothetical protein